MNVPAPPLKCPHCGRSRHGATTPGLTVDSVDSLRRYVMEMEDPCEETQGDIEMHRLLIDTDPALQKPKQDAKRRSGKKLGHAPFDNRFSNCGGSNQKGLSAATFSFNITRPEAKILESLAKELDITASDVVRTALRKLADEKRKP